MNTNQINETLLIDYFYLPAKGQKPKTPKQVKEENRHDSPERKEIKAIMARDGCSFMIARRKYLAS